MQWAALLFFLATVAFAVAFTIGLGFAMVSISSMARATGHFIAPVIA